MNIEKYNSGMTFKYPVRAMRTHALWLGSTYVICELYNISITLPHFKKSLSLPWLAFRKTSTNNPFHFKDECLTVLLLICHFPTSNSSYATRGTKIAERIDSLLAVCWLKCEITVYKIRSYGAYFVLLTVPIRGYFKTMTNCFLLILAGRWNCAIKEMTRLRILYA